MEDIAFPASLNSWITNRMRFLIAINKISRIT